ncbi:MAG: Hsp20/alpha crystallin family protein [Lentisphaerae bacterium]|nr:Hsp20/alpha crystallin family protein [Lentisphaerota bacterium]MCP4102584.1 Hsp20/alpha crystallin family protein [Lentisphaerota bacterium]
MKHEIDKKENTVPKPKPKHVHEKNLMPHVDIIENGANILVLADMPGVDEKSVEVELERQELKISGKVTPYVPEGYTPVFTEYKQGNFQRTFTLGDSINRSGIKAVMKNGVLRLTLPKSKDVQPRKITVLSE